MRNNYFSLSLLFCLLFVKATVAQTNVYYPFVDSSKWNESSYYDCNNCNGDGIYSSGSNGYYYRLINDTILINGKKYHLLNFAETWSVSTLNFVTQSANYGPPFKETTAGAIREDSLHRLYFLCLDSTIFPYKEDSEYLLYDFSLKRGDSLSIFEYGNRSKVFVEGNDSILIGNNYRKTLLISLDTTVGNIFDSWCEGLGSVKGGLFEENVFNGEYNYYSYDCFSVNNQLLYPQSHQGSCDTIIIADINTPATQKLSFQIFPNPASDGLFLKFSQNFIPKEISIYNSIGQPINLPFNAAINKSLDVKNLPAGLYIIKAQDDNNVLTEVFVKE